MQYAIRSFVFFTETHILIYRNKLHLIDGVVASLQRKNTHNICQTS